MLLSLRQKWPDALDEQFVALRIETEFVVAEEFCAWLAVRAEGQRICFAIFHRRVRRNVIVDQFIELFLFIGLFPARDAGREGNENDFSLWQFCMDRLHEV